MIWKGNEAAREFQLTASVDWGEEETQTHGDKTHLWEESWDDDDTSDDFSVQLKAELEKAGSQKKS